MRFWDSSALIPLLVEQASSSDAERWARADPALVVWTLSLVEIVSALRRLVREEALTESEAHEAERVAEDLVESAHVITDLDRVKETASRLLRLHALRAADALQLGAALAWASGSPRGLVLCTFDGRLGLAAQREGFEVVGATL